MSSAGWTKDVGLAVPVRCAKDGAKPQVNNDQAFWSRLRR